MFKNILAFLISASCFSCTSQNLLTSDVPNIRGKLLNGDSSNLTVIAKDKVTLVNVWGIFCSPCMKELPILQKVYEKYKNRKDFAFISVAMDSESELLSFLNQKDTSNSYKKMFRYSTLDSFALPTLACLPHGYTSLYGGYAIVQDSSECKMLLGKINSIGIPTTLIFNRSGKLIFKQVGSVDDTILLTNKIDSLL